MIADDQANRERRFLSLAKIRAGRRDHSIPVDVELEEKTPPDILWHGTGEKYVVSIDAQGCCLPVASV